jgi:putative ABC transport system permease protein
MQVALTMVLLASAGMLADTFVRLMNVEMGFATGNVVAAHLTLPTRRYASPETVVSFADRTIERLRTQPQVAAVALATGMPLSAGVIGSIKVEGQPAQEGAPWAGITAVTSDYFRVLGIPLKRGRLLDFDGQADKVSILVDEALVRRYFPNEDPLGKRLMFYGSTTATIVGVVGDSRDDLSKEPNPHVYQTLSTTPYRFLKVLVRSELAPRDVMRAVRATLQEIDPELPIDKLATMDMMMSDSIARQRFLALLLVVFGGITLAIAAAGIYGLVSYTVTRRLPEIGVRIALGARRSQIVTLITGRGVGLAAVGLALGVVGAVAATRVMDSMLFGAGARNPLVLAGAGLTLGLVAVLASYIPARGASRVNPVTLLRAE